VPGFSYQPPLFGHKRLLNFDAYSFPDVGGWVVIAAGSLAFVVWFIEWYRHRKLTHKTKLVPSIATGLLFLMLASCNTKPEPFQIGKDACYYCKIGITDKRFGGEVISKKGMIRKFDDLHCVISFLKGGGEDEENISRKVTVNFDKPNEFIDVSSATFVISPELKSPMGSNAAGFASKEAAENYAKGKQAEIINWKQLNKKVQ
jgi:copper chaperone NosL